MSNTRIEYCSPPFIYRGMPVYLRNAFYKDEVSGFEHSTDILCEILDIKETTVEVCEMNTKSNCFWVPMSQVKVKIVGHTAVTKIPESPFWKIL